MSKKQIEILEMIAIDMQQDAASFDGRPFNGRPFNGRTVAEYFGNQGAAIAALAGILKAILLEATEGK